MRHIKALTTALACVAALAATAGPASAAQATQTWDFYDCTGPGAPESFSAWKTSQSVGNALHLVDGTGTFVVLIAYNEDLDRYNVPVITPGMTGKAVVRCSTVGPLLGFHLTVWGFFAP
jgi:hypothetical protein